VFHKRDCNIQWLKTLTPNSHAVVLKLYKHAEPLRGFPNFCRAPFLPNKTENKNGLLKSDDLRRTPGTVQLNPRGSILPSVRTSELDPELIGLL